MVAILGLAHTAWAQESDASPATSTVSMEPTKSAGQHGLQLALSVNVSAGALGHVYKNGVSRTTGQPEDLKITDATSASIPILLELGYRASPHCYLGLWGSYEPIFVKTNDISCPEGFDCSAFQWRFGPEVRYHFSPDSRFNPWLGLGVGLEILRSDVEGDTTVPVPVLGAVPAHVSTSVTDRGPTFARVSFGGDVALTRSLALGPIVTASIGSYTVRTGEQTVTLTLPEGVPNPGPQTGPLSPVDDGFHALFTLGVRVVFLPQ